MFRIERRPRVFLQKEGGAGGGGIRKRQPKRKPRRSRRETNLLRARLIGVDETLGNFFFAGKRRLKIHASVPDDIKKLLAERSRIVAELQKVKKLRTSKHAATERAQNRKVAISQLTATIKILADYHAKNPGVKTLPKDIQWVQFRRVQLMDSLGISSDEAARKLYAAEQRKVKRR